MRVERLRKLEDQERLEQELAAKRLEARQVGLTVLIARGAGLRGMDITGLSDPFCVVLWNGSEVGRTRVMRGTRDPCWVGDDDIWWGGGDGVNTSGVELTFLIPVAREWGSEAWPPMHLEVRSHVFAPNELILPIPISIYLVIHYFEEPRLPP